jgi:hypothetical protein
LGNDSRYLKLTISQFPTKLLKCFKPILEEVLYAQQRAILLFVVLLCSAKSMDRPSLLYHCANLTNFRKTCIGMAFVRCLSARSNADGHADKRDFLKVVKADKISADTISMRALSIHRLPTLTLVVGRGIWIGTREYS